MAGLKWVRSACAVALVWCSTTTASAALVVRAPTLALPIPITDANGTFDIVFQNAGGLQPLGDYQVGLQVTPSSAGVTITGAAGGVNKASNSVYGAQDPFFSNSVQPGVFVFTDAAISNPVPVVHDGDVLVRVTYSVKAGTTGTFQLAWFLDDGNVNTGSPWDSTLNDAAGNVIATTFEPGTLAFVTIPEPASVVILAAGCMGLAYRRRHHFARSLSAARCHD